MARFLDAIGAGPGIRFFSVVDSNADHPCDWELEPLRTGILSDTEADGLHIMKALNVLPDGDVRECYMDINIPERISDYAYFIDGGAMRFGYLHDFPSEIIPATALDCFGLYELFYSRRRPDLGIGILRRGLEAARRKAYIAEDLGYILRDERRFNEAVVAFKIAVDEGPSSCFIYGELAAAYAELGDAVSEQKYLAMFRHAEEGGH